MLTWRPGLAKSCVELFTLNRRMHPLNCSNFDCSSIGNDAMLSDRPPIYIIFDALMRRGILTVSATVVWLSVPI